jgi:homoserine dehydrogenase
LVADIVEISRGIVGNVRPQTSLKLDEGLPVQAMRDLETKYYLRISVADRPGVLAQIAEILGDLQISISSVIQKEADEVAQLAELVLTTHRARESSMQEAVKLLQGLEVVDEVGNMVRIEEFDE